MYVTRPVYGLVECEFLMKFNHCVCSYSLCPDFASEIENANKRPIHTSTLYKLYKIHSLVLLVIIDSIRS